MNGGKLTHDDIIHLNIGIYFMNNVDIPISKSFTGIMEIYPHIYGGGRVVFRYTYTLIDVPSPIFTTATWQTDGSYDGWETIYGTH